MVFEFESKNGLFIKFATLTMWNQHLGGNWIGSPQ